VRNSAGTLIDPSNGVTLIYLKNPSGTIKAENKSMTKSEPGKYVYYYNSASDDETGWWIYQVKSQDGTGDSAKYSVSEGGFELK
jgi:hypothetical protein